MGRPTGSTTTTGTGPSPTSPHSSASTEPIDSFACWFWDYDNDGRLDIFVGGFAGHARRRRHAATSDSPTAGEPPRLYRNEGRLASPTSTAEAGLDRVWLPMGSNFGDLDNDGFLDFYLGTG